MFFCLVVDWCDNISVNYIKKTNKMHSLYVFILQFLYKSTCFGRPFLSSSGDHDFTVSAALYKPCKRVQTSPDDERNGRSKHVELYKNCRINTYKKRILPVCLWNWLRCTVHTMSQFLDIKVINESRFEPGILRKESLGVRTFSAVLGVGYM